MVVPMIVAIFANFQKDMTFSKKFQNSKTDFLAQQNEIKLYVYIDYKKLEYFYELELRD